MTGRPLISFYGDDLTGSTDALEALSQAGLDTVLFVRRPDERELAAFGDKAAIGLAGTSRSETPAWMDAELPATFDWLAQLGAPITHYKVCSPFDSSPTIGSIGRAIELGRQAFGGRPVPLVVGVPQLRRYTVFGQHFAAMHGTTYRIDRHPVMSRHPVTPMAEADLRVHLAAQTSLRSGLVDIVMQASPELDILVDRQAAENDIVLFDVLDGASQMRVGRQLRRLARDGGLFVVGSSGVEYALVEAWREAGLVAGPAAFESPGAVDRIAVVSGSCSAITERQIRTALADGFAGIEVDVRRLAGEDGAAEMARVVEQGLAGLEDGRSVIAYTALGPSTDQAASGALPDGFRHAVGKRLGQILGRLVEQAGLTRAVVAGGDTSSHALEALGVLALTVKLPLPQTPGSPLCQSHLADGGKGPELAFKGGQIGKDAYFANVREGIA